MKFKSGIKPDAAITFGNLIFMGLDREKMYFDRDKGERTNILESRIYNLGSSAQKEQIEVTLPDYVDLKEIDFQQPVELKNPIIKARAQSNGNFANVVWTLEAEDIIEVGQGSSIGKKTDAVKDKEPVGTGADKK
ncbi:DUF961 family protein [Geomicrobium sp. JCM 19055]|uniref:DUF961 family protein n=1 Tax=Geomicrobium sp. JCM 19055 TaxID=1460649 RepID=UPI00045ECFBD|nr:DUF961 family protein [Geomicrobium sp. JCM 19055]GAJ99565.1 hypothetical protein JCM19055_2573 [Geomicrobium sp. JCM 19055]